MMTHDIYLVGGVVCTRCKWFLMREKRKYAIYCSYWNPVSNKEEIVRMIPLKYSANKKSAEEICRKYNQDYHRFQKWFTITPKEVVKTLEARGERVMMFTISYETPPCALPE